MKKTKKQIIEEKFHDKWASSTDVKDLNVNENFSLAAQENREALKIFGDLNGKRILDLGCGFGETAVFWALKGATVEATDISLKSIAIALILAKNHKVSQKCHFKQMAAESLNYPDNYFDFVFGNGVLHHLDLQKSIKEVHRVLKSKGKAVFIEPLAYNPVIEVYRKIADDVRTPTEKPLKFSDIAKMRGLFSKVKHKEFQFFTLAIFIWFFLVSRVSPNKERYWKKILKLKGFQKSFLSFLIVMDNILLKFISSLRYLCWNTVIVLEK